LSGREVEGRKSTRVREEVEGRKSTRIREASAEQDRNRQRHTDNKTV